MEIWFISETWAYIAEGESCSELNDLITCYNGKSQVAKRDISTCALIRQTQDATIEDTPLIQLIHIYLGIQVIRYVRKFTISTFDWNKDKRFTNYLQKKKKR